MTKEQWDLPGGLGAKLTICKSDRLLRLFACACCRQIWHLLPDKTTRKAVETAEKYADGLVNAKRLDAVSNEAWDTSLGGSEDKKIGWVVTSLGNLYLIAKGLAELARWLGANSGGKEENIEVKQAGLLRSLFGNPFHYDPSYRIYSDIGDLQTWIARAGNDPDEWRRRRLKAADILEGRGSLLGELYRLEAARRKSPRKWNTKLEKRWLELQIKTNAY